MGGAKNGKIETGKRNDQGGFILPIAMIIMLFFAFYAVNAIDHLANDRDFVAKREIAVRYTQLKVTAARQLLDSWRKTHALPPSGTFTLDHARVDYTTTPSAEGTLRINVRVTDPPHAPQSVVFEIDTNAETITEWED